jgi:hypothetical protein
MSTKQITDRWPILAAIAMAALFVALVGFRNDTDAQISKGKERPLTTKQWMKAVHGAHCGAIKKGLEAGPADDKAWAEVALHAAMMNESSHVLMADGRCPDSVWAGACKTLGEGSAAVLAAVEAKDAAAGLEAFKGMTAACGACHKAHKK